MISKLSNFIRGEIETRVSFLISNFNSDEKGFQYWNIPRVFPFNFVDSGEVKVGFDENKVYEVVYILRNVLSSNKLES